MSKLEKFGKNLKKLRLDKELSLRGVCEKTGYDPSNWSKIERGRLAPPSDDKILKKWVKVLGISKDRDAVQQFIDDARIAQGVIPRDILAQKDAVNYLPAFFRTVRNKKPTKEEIDKLIETIGNA